jgi:hypothetical protein
VSCADVDDRGTVPAGELATAAVEPLLEAGAGAAGFGALRAGDPGDFSVHASAHSAMARMLQLCRATFPVRSAMR